MECRSFPSRLPLSSSPSAIWAGTSGRYIYGDHALDQMEHRNVTRGDVRSALGSATAATFQPDKGRWRITGTDRSGDSLSLAVVFENGIVIITVF